MSAETKSDSKASESKAAEPQPEVAKNTDAKAPTADAEDKPTGETTGEKRKAEGEAPVAVDDKK